MTSVAAHNSTPGLLIKGKCDACGDAFIYVLNPDPRYPLNEEVYVGGCKGCGHALAIDRNQIRNQIRRLTRAEAEQMAAAPWFEQFKATREKFIGRMIG
jgi:hypothetical protein